MLQGLTGPETGPFLEETSQQDESQQHHRFTEKAGPTHLGPNQSHQAGHIGTAHAQAHEGIHAGGPCASSRNSTHQDRTARPQQSHRGQRGVERQAADQRQRQMPCLADMPQHRQQQQHQGHHQLSPLLPPARQRLPGSRRSDRGIQGTLLGREASVCQGFQDTIHITFTGSEIEPGRAADQIHIGALNTGLIQQGGFHSADATAAFHPFHIQDDGLNRRAHRCLRNRDLYEQARSGSGPVRMGVRPPERRAPQQPQRQLH